MTDRTIFNEKIRDRGGATMHPARTADEYEARFRRVRNLIQPGFPVEKACKRVCVSKAKYREWLKKT